MATQKELLDVAAAHDAVAALHSVKIGKAIISVQPPDAAKVPPVSELQLTLEDDDPFNGNVNNRKVAERIAGQNEIVFTNRARFAHTGDPSKAARDIEQSKRVNPDALSEGEIEQVLSRQQAATAAGLSKLKPSPGSPAANKQAEDREKSAEIAAETPVERTTPGAPVVPWTPNAGPAK